MPRRLFIATTCLGSLLATSITLGQLQLTPVIQNPAPIAPDALHLRAGKFTLAAAQSLHASNSAPLRSAMRAVVQLDGPMTPQRRSELTAAGISVGEYLPANAFITRLPVDFQPRAALGGLSYVRWIGAFEKAWKLDPEIGTHGYQTAERNALVGSGQVKLTVALFNGEDLRAAESQIAAMPDVTITDRQQNGEHALIELTMPAANYPQLAEIDAVQWVEDAPELTPRNNTNAWILQSNVTNSTPVWNHGITGLGQIGGHIDGGVNQDHCAFRDPNGNPIGPTHRKIVGYFGSTTYDAHGTHTAGTFAGDPVPAGGAATYRGLAYNAKFSFTNYSSVTSTNLLSKLVQNAGVGARVHTNSWGNDGTTSYIAWTQAVDQFSFENEDNLVCFAVTNLNAAVKTPENAKNCLAVAATQDTPNQGSFCSGGTWYTNDQRRKPEVMAPGCSTVSASGSGTTACSTASLTGTSMASPAVAGAGLLVRQYYTDGFYPSGAPNAPDAFTPSGALIKATLINSAVDATGITGYPSTREGYGRLLLDNALYFSGDSRRLIVKDVRNSSGMTTGGSTSYQVNVASAGEPLEITLVWTEKEAALNANPAYINNLNLVVTAPDNTTYLGNVFTSGQSSTGGSADSVNNTETFLLNAPAVGAWTVTINAVAVNTATPQGFALVVAGDVSETLPLPSVTSITPASAETDSMASITDLHGTNFQNGATAKLARASFPDIPGTSVNYVSNSQLTCSFDLLNAEGGLWDVVVTNPDTQTATLAGAFEVTVTCMKGDLNQDTFVNGDDIAIFVADLINAGGTVRERCAGDVGLPRDSQISTDDVPGFVDCLLQGGCP